MPVERPLFRGWCSCRCRRLLRRWGKRSRSDFIVSRAGRSRQSSALRRCHATVSSGMPTIFDKAHRNAYYSRLRCFVGDCGGVSAIIGCVKRSIPAAASTLHVLLEAIDHLPSNVVFSNSPLTCFQHVVRSNAEHISRSSDCWLVP